MSDKWERAVKGMRESMDTYRRRHRPDYAILARTAWDEEWDARCVNWRAWDKDMLRAECCLEVRALLRNLSRDPAFIEAGKR